MTRWLRKTDTGEMFIWTPELATRDDMVEDKPVVEEEAPKKATRTKKDEF